MKPIFTLLLFSGLAFSQTASNGTTTAFEAAYTPPRPRPAKEGITFCGYRADAGTIVDGASPNDSATDDAVLARWLDQQPSGAVHTAIFLQSDRSCIAKDGQVIDGRTIVRILPASLLLGNASNVAYEALYTTGNASAQVRRGAFVNSHFAFDINPALAAPQDQAFSAGYDPDFVFDSATGELVPNPAAVLTPPQKTGKPTPASKPSGCDPKSLIKGALTIRQKLGLDLPKGCDSTTTQK